MTYPADLGEPARLAYAAGITPIDYAEAEVEALIGIHRHLAASCAMAGAAPDADISDAALSRRILGLILNAGWAPPGGIEIPEVTP